MYYKRKKASLSLSINAIVILILAITMLGLGLTFMRGLFKQMQEKVGEAVSAQELTNPPTIDNVVTMAPSETTIRQKDVGTVVIAYLNTKSSDTCNLEAITAQSGGVNVADIAVSIQPITMAQDQINTWTAAIKPKTGLTLPATGLYTFEMKCLTTSYTKDLVVTVVS